LIIASGFPPFEFSENIVNGKLALALLKSGHEIKVITKVDEGDCYNDTWHDPWLPLRSVTYIIQYSHGNYLQRFFEILKCFYYLKYPLEGIRWAWRACKKAEDLMSAQKFDAIITRSPSDISHLPGLWLKKRHNIKWIANWNDPAAGIWPEPYNKKMPLWKKYLMRLYVQEVINAADKSTFPSELLAGHFKKYFRFSETKISIVPHLMVSFNYPDIDGIKTGDLYICHSGNISIERDPRNLFKAISEINSENEQKIYLEITGVISENFKEIIFDGGLEEYIKVSKPLPYNEALRRMKEFDVLVILEALMEQSIFLPSKISDYTQFDIPVLAISPSTSELANVFRKFGGGIAADNKTLEDIKNKLLLFLELKRTAKLKTAFSKTNLRGYLSEERVTQTLAEIISE
jgi:glycosyltransferase involved in cell wall biosynthesis